MIRSSRAGSPTENWKTRLIRHLVATSDAGDQSAAKPAKANTTKRYSHSFISPLSTHLPLLCPRAYDNGACALEERDPWRRLRRLFVNVIEVEPW